MVPTIHEPTDGKLTRVRARQNVEAFLRACKQCGVYLGDICTVYDVTQCSDLNKVFCTVEALCGTATAAHPDAS